MQQVKQQRPLQDIKTETIKIHNETHQADHLHFVIYALQNHLQTPSLLSMIRSSTRNQKKAGENAADSATGRVRNNSRRQMPGRGGRGGRGGKPVRVQARRQPLPLGRRSLGFHLGQKYGFVHQKENLNLRTKALRRGRGGRGGRGTRGTRGGRGGSQLFVHPNMINPLNLPGISNPLNLQGLPLNPPGISNPLNLIGLPGQINVISPFSGNNNLPSRDHRVKTVDKLPKQVDKSKVQQIKQQLQLKFPEKTAKIKSGRGYQQIQTPKVKAFAIKSSENIILKAERNICRNEHEKMRKQQEEREQKQQALLIQQKQQIQQIQQIKGKQVNKYNTCDIKQVIGQFNREVPLYFQKKKKNQKRRRLEKHELIKTNKAALYQIYGNAIFSKCWPISRQEIRMALGLLEKDNIEENAQLVQTIFTSEPSEVKKESPEQLNQIEGEKSGQITQGTN